MVRKVIPVAVLALGVLAASSGAALAANSITNIHFSPAYPATLAVYPFTSGTPAVGAPSERDVRLHDERPERRERVFWRKFRLVQRSQ